MSFVTNHDTDRNAGEYVGHKDGDTFILANTWLLAQGYGSPQVYSSFEWTDGPTPRRTERHDGPHHRHGLQQRSVDL